MNKFKLCIRLMMCLILVPKVGAAPSSARSVCNSGERSSICRGRLAFLIAIAMFFVPLCVAYLSHPVQTKFLFPENTVWKHRQNNSELAIKSITSGYSGIELDIMLIGGQLRVAHDEGEVLRSESVNYYLAELERENLKPVLWMDIKNNSFSNELEIRHLLLELIERFQLEGRLLVESPRPLQMIRLCQTVIKCSIWTKYTDYLIPRVWYRAMVRGFSRGANLSAMSIDFRSADNVKAMVPNSFPVLLFTFPSSENLANFDQDPRYRVLLTD